MAIDLQSDRSSVVGDASLKRMLGAFRRGSRLIDAALETLSCLTPRIDALAYSLSALRHGCSLLPIQLAVLSLGTMLDGATAEGDNVLLLSMDDGPREPLVVFTLARHGAGTLAVQSLEIDRAMIALSDGGRRRSNLTYDRLVKVSRDVSTGAEVQDTERIGVALAAFRAQTISSASRLSIAKARFDLQASFLKSVGPSEGQPSMRLDSGLDGSEARDMAYSTRQLLSGRAASISNTNRALRELLASKSVRS